MMIDGERGEVGHLDAGQRCDVDLQSLGIGDFYSAANTRRSLDKDLVRFLWNKAKSFTVTIYNLERALLHGYSLYAVRLDETRFTA